MFPVPVSWTALADERRDFGGRLDGVQRASRVERDGFNLLRSLLWPVREIRFPSACSTTRTRSNVGVDSALTPQTVQDLRFERLIPVRSDWVNATPVIADGLLFVGDMAHFRYGQPPDTDNPVYPIQDTRRAGHFYVFDLENGDRPLVVLETSATVMVPLIGRGVQSTAVLARVTVPNGAGGTREERRVYFGANVKPRSMWCLNVDKILERRKTLNQSDGKDLLCDGADWPIVIAGLGDLEENRLTSPFPVDNASPLYRANQRVRVDGRTETRDVSYTPTIGADCSDGQMWAVDAYTGQTLWTYDPVPNYVDASSESGVSPGYGGATDGPRARSQGRDDLRHDRRLRAAAAGRLPGGVAGCARRSRRVGEVVSPAPTRRHQRLRHRQLPNSGGCSWTGPCSVVVTPDKNGCIYGFDQQSDVPQIGDLAFDPFRPGQQRVRWRTCLVPGSLYGGFNASGAAAHGRTTSSPRREPSRSSLPVALRTGGP